MRPIALGAWLAPDTEAHVLSWKGELLSWPDLILRQKPGHELAASEAAMLVSGGVSQSLLDASAHFSDDLVVMERLDEAWRCTSLTLTAPTFFSIDDAFDRDLSALHGPVPDGPKLAQRIGRVFDGLQPDTVLERFNWTLQCGPDRHTPDGAPLRARAATVRPEDAEATLHLRVERQTIRKLPKTGAVLFAIRVCLDPLTHLPSEDRPPLAAAWRSLQGDGRAYKRWDAMDRLVEDLFGIWGV